MDRFIYESMGEKQYLISCLDDDLFKKALKGFRKECPEIDSKTNGFRMCLEALQASELFTEISFIDLHGTKFPLNLIYAADGYENQLSATAEIINTSSAKGTATLTLKVNPSLFTCVNISTEISEFFDCIASAPLIDFGSTVLSSWAVAVLRGRNEHPYRLSSLSGNPRRESYTADNDLFFYKQSRKSAGARLLRPESPLVPRRAFYRKPTESLSAFLAEKMPEQNNRPGIQHDSLSFSFSKEEESCA